MEKLKIMLRECCLTCKHIDLVGIKGIVYSPSDCGQLNRVIACNHMKVCWQYNTQRIDSQIPQKPVNIKKQEGKICNADCPACGYSFPDIGGINESYGEVEQYEFCPDCGQKIDWAD